MGTSRPRDSRIVGIVPTRLAASVETHPLPDSVIDVDHERVGGEALAWQQAAGLASFWEMGAAHRGADQNRAYALAGQMASAGEQLGLAAAACNEVAIWREDRARRISDEVAMRGMAEAHCLFVMSTGHAFANVGLRALALDPALRSELSLSFRRGSHLPTFGPFSTDRRDWISMNREACRALDAAAESSNKIEVVKLIQPISKFGLGTAWRELDNRRGEDFHRWRMQTHGIEGVPRKTPWSGDGRTRILEIGHPAYEEAQGLGDEVARIADDAMLDLARAMGRYREQWTRASGHLGGPEFRST